MKWSHHCLIDSSRVLLRVMPSISREFLMVVPVRCSRWPWIFPPAVIVETRGDSAPITLALVTVALINEAPAYWLVIVDSIRADGLWLIHGFVLGPCATHSIVISSTTSTTLPAAFSMFLIEASSDLFISIFSVGAMLWRILRTFHLHNRTLLHHSWNCVCTSSWISWASSSSWMITTADLLLWEVSSSRESHSISTVASISGWHTNTSWSTWKRLKSIADSSGFRRVEM
jgi:hypothetical protein